MDLRSHVNGNKAAQLQNILLHLFQTTTDAQTILTAISQFGFDIELDRVAVMTASGVKTLATIDDVYDGHGNTAYISETEPTGLPVIGIVSGDLWYNSATSELKMSVEPTALTLAERWTDITNTNITYTIPLIQASHTYANLSVFVYSDFAANISNGNESVWQNQSGSNAITPATVSSESDLVTAGFTKIGGGAVPDSNIAITVDYTWGNGSHTVGSYSVVKSNLTYSVDISTSTPKSATFKRTTTNQIIGIDYSIDTTVLTFSTKNALTENILVNIRI
jgi:hypothetical protein